MKEFNAAQWERSIQCEPGSFLSDWVLSKEDNGETRFYYKCAYFNTKNQCRVVYSRPTKLNDKSGPADIAKMPVECPGSNEAIQGFTIVEKDGRDMQPLALVIGRHFIN